MCATACAPSTIVRMLRCRASRLSSRTGKSCPVMFVMWQKCSTFVRGGQRALKTSNQIVGTVVGTGNCTRVTAIRSRTAR